MVRQRWGKVKAVAKDEMRQVRSLLNLDLSLLRSFRPCLGQDAFLGEEAV